VNPNARELLHPTGIDRRSGSSRSTGTGFILFFPAIDGRNSCVYFCIKDRIPDYVRLTYPKPSLSHALYPFFTPGGGDKRWIACDGVEEGFEWVGPLMFVPKKLTPCSERF
jgi:hypothetical protein